MSEETDLSGLYGSVGWLVDRTSQNRQILGTVWLIRTQVAIACTHTLIPYFDVPEALGVDFPHVGKRYGVKEILPHSFYDPWLIKRTYQHAPIYPPHHVAVETNNISALTLNPTPPPLDKAMFEKVSRLLTRSMPDEESSLAGSATQLQITSIIQTLLSNRNNQGTLTLFDSHNNPIAKFYLRENQLTHIRYAHLYNEEAMYRLLTMVSEEESFAFTFVFDFEPEWAKFPPMQKSTAGLLMEAYTRMESYQQILTEFGNNLNIVVSQAVPALNLDPLPLEIRPAVACTWNHVKHGIPLGRLLKACNFDGSTIMYAVKYLRETGQVSGLEYPPATHLEPAKLSIANNCSLERGTPIQSISIDPETRLPVVENGFILDFFPAKGDFHYVHSIGLPPSAAGAPLLVNGEVVGVHFGILTEGVESYADWIHPSLAVAGDQVYQCLDLNPTMKTGEVLAFTPPNVGDRLTSGPELESSFTLDAVDVAPDMGAGWSRTTVAQEQLGRHSQDVPPVSMSPRDRRAEDRARATGETNPITVKQPDQSDTGSFKRKSGFFDTIGNMFKGGKSGLENDAFEVNLLKQGLDSDKFEKISVSSAVRPGDTVRVRVKFVGNSYAAVLLKSDNEETVRLIYPESPAYEEQLAKGTAIEVPSQYTEPSSYGRKKVFSGIPVNSADGTDAVMVISGPQPLVVRLFELGPDRVFNFVSETLGMEQAGKFHVNRMEIARADATIHDPQNVLTICILQLRHGG
jgi:hypothetical protein